MKKGLRGIALLCALALSMAVISGCAAKKTTMKLNILNWGDFIDESVLKKFKEEYPQIDVNYETMASNEEMLVQLKSGSIHDICFPSDYTIQKLNALDLLQPIDHSKLSNLGNIDSKFLNQSFDPNNEYSIPYMWGTVGILYNKTMVSDPVDSWSILWDAKYKGQILMYDSVRDSMAVALLRLGYSINTKNLDEIEQAKQSLIEQKPLVLAYGQDDIRDKMISGSAALSVVYSGDAIASVAENEDLAYVVPKEGSNIWFDNVVITKSSKNLEAAYLFIDFLMRPDIAKLNTEFIGYSTPNKAAFDLLSDDMKNDIVYWPTQAEMDRCTTFQDLGDVMRIYEEAWQAIKMA